MLVVLCLGKAEKVFLGGEEKVRTEPRLNNLVVKVDSVLETRY